MHLLVLFFRRQGKRGECTCKAAYDTFLHRKILYGFLNLGNIAEQSGKLSLLQRMYIALFMQDTAFIGNILQKGTNQCCFPAAVLSQQHNDAALWYRKADIL